MEGVLSGVGCYGNLQEGMLLEKVRSDMGECIKILYLREKHCNQNGHHLEKITYIKLFYNSIRIIDYCVRELFP